MADEIDELIEDFLNESKKLGIDIIEELKRECAEKSKREYTEKELRYFFRLIFDQELFKKTFGVTLVEYQLMKDGLTLEEAQYVIEHPCLEDAYDRCSVYKEDGKCVPFGCTLLNGWLFFKTGPNEKRRPNYKAIEQLPKDTLYINAEDIKNGKLNKKIKEFLDEPNSP